MGKSYHAIVFFTKDISIMSNTSEPIEADSVDGNFSINNITLNKWKKVWQEIRFVEHNKHKLKKLSEQEMRVFKLFAKGNTINEITAKLNINSMTAQMHKQNIYKKLSIKSLWELFEFANCFDLLEVPLQDPDSTYEMLKIPEDQMI